MQINNLLLDIPEVGSGWLVFLVASEQCVWGENLMRVRDTDRNATAHP